MTVDKFLEFEMQSGIPVMHLGVIPNKTLSKVFKKYKYIDINVYWYDNFDYPEELMWEDVEGIGYGWLWLGFLDKYHNLREKKFRKRLNHYAMAWHHKEEILKWEYDNIVHYSWGSNDRQYIVEVRLSNEELFF